MQVDRSIPILVVDDEQVMISLATRVLSTIGFEQIDQASDGEQALSMLRRKRYQMVIADLRMQPIGGLQLLRSVRQEDGLKHIRFVLMTASLAPEPIAAAKQAGADAYLLKPFTPRQLRAKLKEIFA